MSSISLNELERKQSREKVTDVETLSFCIQKLFLLRFRTNCLKIEAKKDPENTLSFLFVLLKTTITKQQKTIIPTGKYQTSKAENNYLKRLN